MAIQLEMFPDETPSWDEVEDALLFYMQKASQLETQLKEIKEEIQQLKFSMVAANMDCDKIWGLAGSGVEDYLQMDSAIKRPVVNYTSMGE